jgi:Xaa-Pro aminopeptidase
MQNQKHMPHPTPSPLLYADSDSSADQLYFTGFHAGDPFIAFGVGRKRYGVFSALEISRARKQSSVDGILSLPEWQDRARRYSTNGKPGPAEVIKALARHFKIRRFNVPEDFPAGLLLKLRELGVKVDVATGPFIPKRMVKTPAEVAAIREGNRLSSVGFRVAERMLKASTIRNGALMLDRKPLTSERLKFAIEVAILEQGGVSQHTIIAGGDQACDPHCTGTGPLRANELIIFDIFPRVTANGYHGDMTRTYLKGTASDAQRALVDAVRGAHRLGMKSIKAGAHGINVHKKIVKFFEAAGYVTANDEKGTRGFFHGTGHGLGLDIHEQPGMGVRGTPLRAGNVVTVEPGLYYPGLGGCRFEDVVLVTKGGCELVSRHPYGWEIA